MLTQDDPMSPLKELARGEGEAYPVLRQAIADLYLRPGAIFSIKDICEHFGIGRSPVRDALLRLDQEGLVALLPQRGTMISRINLSRVRQERFMRLSVEEEVMKLFLACHTPSDILLLNEVLRQQREAAERNECDTRRFIQLDDEFHHVFYTVADKEYCYQALQTMSGHYYRVRLLNCNDIGNMQTIMEQHSSLITAMQTRDAELMRQVFHLHLGKLDREEAALLKKYPHLFEGVSAASGSAPFWQGDFLQSLTLLGQRPTPQLAYRAR